MKLEKPCIPWYFPRNDTSELRLCNPWEAMDFRKIIDKTPVHYYSHCLTDCGGIIYHASVTNAPFSRCDFKNIGVSDLCNFESDINPAIWGESVKEQYMDEVEKANENLEDEEDVLDKEDSKLSEKRMPDYITDGITTSQRKYAGEVFFSEDQV